MRQTLTIEEMTKRDIGMLSMDVILGQICQRYFEGKIQIIVNRAVKAEREACAQIAREEAEKAMRFSGPSASIYCAQIVEQIEARNK